MQENLFNRIFGKVANSLLKFGPMPSAAKLFFGRCVLREPWQQLRDLSSPFARSISAGYADGAATGAWALPNSSVGSEQSFCYQRLNILTGASKAARNHAPHSGGRLSDRVATRVRHAGKYDRDTRIQCAGLIFSEPRHVRLAGGEAGSGFAGKDGLELSDCLTLPLSNNPTYFYLRALRERTAKKVPNQFIRPFC